MKDLIIKARRDVITYIDDKLSLPKCLLQILTAIIFLVTFWSLTFLLMELLAFGVEMAVYTFIGLILTSDVTTQYLSIIFFLVLYGHGSVARVAAIDDTCLQDLNPDL